MFSSEAFLGPDTHTNKRKKPMLTKPSHTDPPNYVPGQEGDPSNSGFGDNKGDNGCGTSTTTGCNGTPDDDDTYGYFTQ